MADGVRLHQQFVEVPLQATDDLTVRLAQQFVEVPLQAIMARAPFWNEDYEAFVKRLAPGVDYRVMEGVGHLLMLEKPDAFNAILGEFLKKQGLLKP